MNHIDKELEVIIGLIGKLNNKTIVYTIYNGIRWVVKGSHMYQYNVYTAQSSTINPIARWSIRRIRKQNKPEDTLLLSI